MAILNLTWNGPQPYIAEGQPFVDTINLFQGAVTTDGFSVNAKMTDVGQVKLVVYSDEARTSKVKESPLFSIDSDSVAKLKITGLAANTQYYWAIEVSGMKCSIMGKAKTFPIGAANYKILASSCARGTGGEGGSAGSNQGVSNHSVFNNMRTAHSDALMFFHMGDLHYRNINSNNVNLFHSAYDDVLRQSNQQSLYKDMPLHYMFDDHDFGPNDSNSTSPSKPAAIKAYKSRVPHYPLVFNGENDPTTQSFAIGRVRYIMLDVISAKIFNQTILGPVQKQWLKDTLLTVTEPVICLMAQDPWITTLEDNGWNGAPNERAELISFFQTNGLTDRIFMVYGDTHMAAMDDGTHSGGFPCFLFSSLDSGGTLKGGPYSQGYALDAAGGQYGAIEIADTGTTISVKATAYRFKGGIQTELITYTKLFST